MRGVGRQMEAFKEGFNSVYPLSSLQGLICPGEVCVGWVGGMGEKVERWGGKGRMYEKEGMSRLIWEDRSFLKKGREQIRPQIRLLSCLPLYKQLVSMGTHLTTLGTASV